MSHQAITTKFVGPTNTRGSRVKATCEAGSLSVPWDYALGVEDNHRAAARALIAKLGREGNWAMGCDRHMFVFVCLARGAEKTPHPQILGIGGF